jgi:uncharacterized protein (TIGR04222 family)
MASPQLRGADSVVRHEILIELHPRRIEEKSKMNPLDMMGPAFLAFYALYGIVGFVLVLLIKSSRDAHTQAGRWMPGQYPREEEAYHLALLRDGSHGVAATLLARLFSSGLAVVEGGKIQTVPNEPERQRGLLPIERTALAALPVGVQTAEAMIAGAVHRETDTLRDDLTRNGLMPSLEQTQASRRLLLATLAAIPGLGALKLLVALARGRTNILFLILMIIVYIILAAGLLRLRSRTPAGDRYLKWLQDSHKGLLYQAQDGRSDGTVGLALAAGIYGLAAVPQMEPLDMALHPRRPQDSSSSGGCGSGSGGDGGGGDGGGGGCGGCGGGD